MLKKEEMRGSQIQDYHESQRLTLKNLNESILKLQNRNDEAGSPGEVAENDGAILDLTRKKAMVLAKCAAFDANQHVVEPPSVEQLDKLRGLIEAVETLTVQQRVFDEVMRLSKDSLSTFREIHPDPL